MRAALWITATILTVAFLGAGTLTLLLALSAFVVWDRLGPSVFSARTSM